MLIIGAGFGGICMGIKAKAAGLDVLILERANDIGGTWRENIYPGCACDTQSHHYSFSFFMKSDWSRRFAGHAEILEYLHSAVDAFDLRDDICLNHAVRAIHFDKLPAETGPKVGAEIVRTVGGRLQTPVGTDALKTRRLRLAQQPTP